MLYFPFSEATPLPAIDAFARILYDFKSQISSLEGLNPRDLTVMQLCEGLRDVANSVAINYQILIRGDTSWDEELASLKRPTAVY